MSQACLKIANRKDFYLQETRVENLFIAEYLPDAPGEFVKVYLFGLMYAQNNLTMDISKLSRVFRIDEDTVIKAWHYWEQKGLLNVTHNYDKDSYEIEYVSQMDKMYGNDNKIVNAEPEKKNVTQLEIEKEDTEDEAISKVIDMEIQNIFHKYENVTGRTLSYDDCWKIGDTVKTYKILPDVMAYAIDYCASEDRTSVNHIVKTAIKWAQEGCHNLLEVKEYLDAHSKKNKYYNYIFSEMGFNRLPNPVDRELMNKWFDEMGFTIKEVLDACKQTAGMRNPDLRYVNKILENKKLEAGGINTRKQTSVSNERSEEPVSKAPVSRKVLKEYYDYIRSEGEKEQDARIDEVCRKVIALRDLFDFENKLNLDMLSMSLGGDNREQKKLIREQKKDLEIEKKALLVENGFPEDYLVRKYKCEACKDTGITDDGRVCSCSEERAEEAYKWNQRRTN